MSVCLSRRTIDVLLANENICMPRRGQRTFRPFCPRADILVTVENLRDDSVYYSAYVIE